MKEARGEFAVLVTTLFASAMLGGLGCSSSTAAPSGASGGSAGNGSVAGGGEGAEGGSAACRTPADEDLEPHLDFTSVVAVTLRAPSCTDGGPNGGGPAAGSGGGPGATPGGGPGAAPGGPGAGPGGGPGGLGPAEGAAPPAIFDDFPNEFGVVAQEQLASQLGIFAETKFGANGRFCESCHANQNDWSLTPAFVRARFFEGQQAFSGNCSLAATNQAATENDELESIFRTVDGTTSPLAHVSTPDARERAYSLLLSRALIRIGLAVPSDADFELIEVDDPYGFASAEELSLFRRSPTMANLRFNTSLMWDGRENSACSSLKDILREQAVHAVERHAEGEKPASESIDDMVQTELQLYLAQLLHNDAGRLDEDGAQGGPVPLAQAPFYWGINAFDQVDPRGQAYSPEIFGLYGSWRDLPLDSDQNRARAAIAEGERLFNERQFIISGVSGFNDELQRDRVSGTCGACHNTPSVGTNSEGRLMDLGVSDEAQRSSDLPLYTFRERASGQTLKTTDPGQALSSGRWAHLNRFKVPGLRGIAGRAPYFHNGAAPSLAAVVDYHDQRFEIQLSAEEKAALVAFLSAL